MHEIRQAVDEDSPAVLLLNQAEVAQTSELDRERLRQLAAMSEVFSVVMIEGRVGAFLLALGAGAAYENDNFSWFSARYSSFIYVDRIVVDARFAGTGLGSSLYRHLFAHARALEIPLISCEYNIEPPNPASKAFHQKFGFFEVGQQSVAGGSKRVSLQVAATQ